MKGMVVLVVFVLSELSTTFWWMPCTGVPSCSTMSVSTGWTTFSRTTMSCESHIVVPTMMPSPT